MTTHRPGNTLASGASELCNRAWWVFLIGGIASVAFGVMALIKPATALFVLAMFFAAYILVDGMANILGALTHQDKEGWWAVLLFGALGVVVGGFALFAPPVSITAFVYVVALVALLIGLTSLYVGWKVRAEIAGEWLLYVTGLLSVFFALIIFTRPGIGGLYVVYLIASWAIVIGLLRIWFAFRIRRLRERFLDARVRI